MLCVNIVCQFVCVCVCVFDLKYNQLAQEARERYTLSDSQTESKGKTERNGETKRQREREY